MLEQCYWCKRHSLHTHVVDKRTVCHLCVPSGECSECVRKGAARSDYARTYYGSGCT